LKIRSVFRFLEVYAVLELLKKSKKIIGTKQTLKSVENKTVKVVFIARDADKRITDGLVKLCEKNSIKLIYVDNMKQLGKACGIEVGAAAAALLEEADS
jgi:large subunit ribosomal protein L7A